MKTVNEIYQEMRETMAAETGMEIADNCELAVRLYAAAAQVCGLYAQNEWTLRQCFPQTAQGVYLDHHAALRGLQRGAATRAWGTLRFQVPQALTGELVIEAGTVCMTAGLVRFETTRQVVLAAGQLEVDAPAQAVETGAGGNVAAGAVRVMAVAPLGVSACTNPAPFTGGAEEEGDEALRGRILETFLRLPNGANAAYYEREALAVESVAAVNVLGRHRGVGTVDVVIATPQGMPGVELLAAVEEKLQAAREIAVDVRVLAPAEVSVPVTVDIQVEDGASFDGVSAQVADKLAGYFDGRLLGQSVYRARLGQLIFGVDGVKNYAICAPEEDVAIQPGQLPRLGTIQVEAMA